MFKFIKPKGSHLSAERQKIHKELFCYRRTLQHGFPHKPTAMAWDPTLRLLCIGTSTGAIKVFGKPGVEFYGQHSQNETVIKLVFLPNAGRIVSLCAENSLHLWEVNKSSLVQVTSHAMEGKLKRISALCVDSTGERLYLGTEGGNIYIMDLKEFKMTVDIVYQDIVLQSISHKQNPGAVEAIIEQPDHPERILIAYNHGLIVLWDLNESRVLKTFKPTHQLESAYWHAEGTSFVTSHIDGSYMVWNVDESDESTDLSAADIQCTYGPYPCKAIPKIQSFKMPDSENPLIVFSGGLPRADYGDKHTVTAFTGDDKHVTFELSTKIIDFAVICSKDEPKKPEALLILADEEIVAIDLLSDDWKVMRLPYLYSLHDTPMTCSYVVSNVPEELWNEIKSAGLEQNKNLYSDRAWPVDGGDLLCSKGSTPHRDLLLLGLESGAIVFYDAGSVALKPLYTFKLAPFIQGNSDENAEHEEEEEEEWPPFRKVGVFDPYSDDPRYAVQQISLCPISKTMVVGFAAGQLLITQFGTEVYSEDIKTLEAVILPESDGVWKGVSKVSLRIEGVEQQPGFQCRNILQVNPPSSIVCVALQADWGLTSLGTAYGLVLYDFIQNKVVLTTKTYKITDTKEVGEGPISRAKSFKKSIRESIRRLRRGRSQRRPNQEKPQVETKPVERQIEARNNKDPLNSLVKCLYFARTFLIDNQSTVCTLWAGTYAGTVYVYIINIPNSAKRTSEEVKARLGKEIQLKHRAPVLNITVLDSSNRPLPDPLQPAPLPGATQPHRVILSSEEQFKIFTLPALKPFNKFKLAAQEGALLRRLSFGNFTCKVPDTEADVHSEVDLMFMTNNGECCILTLPDLKRQMCAVVTRKEDVNGISTTVYTKDAEALYFLSPSEIQRISLGNHRVTSARCYLALPNKPEEEKEVNKSPVEQALVNGTSDPNAEKLENGVNSDDTNSTLHNSTMTSITSSIGDITIDSVRDHTNEEVNKVINATVKSPSNATETQAEPTPVVENSN